MLPGDNEEPSWKALLTLPQFVEDVKDVTILLAPHHGRMAGYYSELFNYLKPELTIISDGPFGDTSATDRYSKVSKGKYIISKKNSVINRNCVTTRNDGVIRVEVEQKADKSYFAAVFID